MARVRALLRRRHPAPSVNQAGGVVSAGALEIDTVSHVARLSGETVELTPREFDLLALLTSNPGRAYTREQLLESLWGHDYVGDQRTVDVHVRWLRRKIEEEPSSPRLIVTVRGVGYRFDG